MTQQPPTVDPWYVYPNMFIVRWLGPDATLINPGVCTCNDQKEHVHQPLRSPNAIEYVDEGDYILLSPTGRAVVLDSFTFDAIYSRTPTAWPKLTSEPDLIASTPPENTEDREHRFGPTLPVLQFAASRTEFQNIREEAERSPTEHPGAVFFVSNTTGRSLADSWRVLYSFLELDPQPVNNPVYTMELPSSLPYDRVATLAGRAIASFWRETHHANGERK